MDLKGLSNRIKKIEKECSETPTCRKGYLGGEIQGIKETILAIESLCIKEEDGLETYENRHAEGKGDGIWINAEDLIKLKTALK